MTLETKWCECELMRSGLLYAVLYTNRPQLSVFCKIKVYADRWVETGNCWKIRGLQV